MKPVVLYVGNPIRSHTQRWAELSARLQVLYYRPLALPELVRELQPGGRYSAIEAIFRPNNTLADNLPPLDERLVPHLPPSLRLVASVNHGYDGEDTAALAARGIWYCNGAGAANDSTADLALFLLLACFRRTSFCEHTVRSLRRGNFYDIEGAVAATAQNPRGRLLGVVGLGEIGQAVAERAQRALGMAIHYTGRRRKSAAVEQRLGGAVYHARLESLLAVADCVVLACPHTEETHHLLDARTFAMMKKGVRVVNVGRGKCVDEEALADALEAGIVSAAGLDVYEEEPRINERLLDSWQVTLMPHIGGATVDTQANFERIAMDNLEAFFFGDGKPVTPVNTVES